MSMLTSEFQIECELGGRAQANCDGNCTHVDEWKEHATVCQYLQIRSMIKTKGKKLFDS